MPQKKFGRSCLQLAIVCQRYERLAVKKMFWAITLLRARESLEKRLVKRSVQCDLKYGLNRLKSSNNQAVRGKFAVFFFLMVVLTKKILVASVSVQL